MSIAGAAGQTYRIVVQSIGTAAFGIVSVIEKHAAVPGAELAACLYRAPGILFDGLTAEAAALLVEKLSPSGLELEVQASSEAFEPGKGDLDVVLEVQSYDRIAAILREVTLLLGIDVLAARDLLCQSPCLLLGSVSEATVRAVTRRFEPLGARVVSLDPKAARYDLFVTTSSPQLAARIVENLAVLGKTPAEGPAADYRVVEDLDYATANQLWEQLGRRNDAVRLIARDLQRFDVILDAFPDTQEALDCLSALTGAPADAMPRVLSRLPLVIGRGLGRDDMLSHLARLLTAGATAHAELTAFQAFRIELATCPKPDAITKVLRRLGDVPGDRMKDLGQKHPSPVYGPFLEPRARWLKHELTALGASVRMVRS